MKEQCAALTIAGSDSGGGAGIQADLKTFSAYGVFGTTAITAITAQTLASVYQFETLSLPIISKQITSALAEFHVRAVKTGMLVSSEIIETVFNALNLPENKNIPLVVDPVFIATSGSRLIDEAAVETLIGVLFKRALVITPNIPEAQAISGQNIENVKDLEQVGKELFSRLGVSVLMKGGHLDYRNHTALDILVYSGGIKYYESPMISNVNTHGSGCTLSAAITAGLASGLELPQAVKSAKEFITRSLENPVLLAPGVRVINHFHNR